MSAANAAAMLQGRRALVTGSTRGIGRAVAELLHAAGAEVVLHGRTAEAVGELTAALATPVGPAPAGVAGDLADRAACRRIAAAASPVDILVNCAGVFDSRSIGESDGAFWDWTMAINLTAPWLLAQALLPGLRRRQGVIVNVASDAALLGYAGSSVYCAAKGALVGLTRALAVELAPEVRAIAVCPGPVETDMARTAWAKSGDPQAARAEWERAPLLGRLATAEEIARVVLFAASPAAAYLTGTVIAADGGASAGKRLPP